MRFIPRITDVNAFRVTVEGVDIEKFRRSTTWKMRMPAVKARAIGFENQDIVFPKDMPSRDIDAVISALSACSEWGYETIPDASFRGTAAINQAHLDKIAGVGLAIKSRDNSILEEFRAFSDTVNQEMARPLREKQMWDAFFMCSMRKSANFSVPGSGKTASTLGVFAYLHSRGLVDRIVVISPKNAFGSWRDEWMSCFNKLIPCQSLCFHDLKWSAKSPAVKRKELKFNASRYNLILLNYEATGNYDEVLREIVADRSLLVFDEVHKVKAIGGVRASSALETSRDAKYVIALTGTPIPNSYCDIYNLLHILYPDDYDSFFGFAPSMLAKPMPSDVDAINQSLQPFFCRTNKKELGVPEASPDMIYSIEASIEENDLLFEVREAYRRDPLALIIRCLQMESDPSMLQDTLDKSEFEYVVDGDGGFAGPSTEPLARDTVAHACTMPPTTKTRECIRLADELTNKGRPVIIWCFFTRSMHNISCALAKRGHQTAIICGTTSQDERLAILDDFKKGELDILVTNPHTLAESVSLHSVCHDAIYFEYSYNLVHMLQSKDRIHRLGLPDGQYTQYHFLQSQFRVESGTWSLDGKIYDRLKEKENVMLEAIDRGVLEQGSTDKADLREVFDGLFDPPLEALQE